MSCRIYDEFVPYYDLVYADRSKEIAFYRGLLRPGGTRVLELGCGTGAVLAGIADHLTNRAGTGCFAVGLDHSMSMLQWAKAHHRAPHWIQGDISDPPLHGAFDLIFCAFNTLQMLESDEDVLAAMSASRSLLAPDGVLAFDIYNPACESAASIAPELRRNRIVRSFIDARGNKMEVLENATEAADERSVNLDWRVMNGSAPSLPHAKLELRLRHHRPLEIDQIVRTAGFSIRRKYGDVEANPFDERTSVKQVVVCSR